MRDNDQNDDQRTSGDDPFKGLYGQDGGLDVDVVSRRLGTLVELLRTHAPCFALRLSFDDLARVLGSPAGADIRTSEGEDQFEDALRSFSRHYLHDVVEAGAAEKAGVILQSIADDKSLSRKRRQAAAAGVALVAGLPDDAGLRGRGLFDLLLRITLEELHAQEQLRKRAEEEGGLDAAELEEFWKRYPALRHHYEERYRQDVSIVLEAIDADALPLVISVDIAIRGAHRLLTAVASARAAGGGLDGERAREILEETYEDDFLDGGRSLVMGRWSSAGQTARRMDDQVEPGSEDDQKRIALAETCERAVRLAAPGSPGGELILFSAYMRAVLEGSFHVRDAAEAKAAGAMFGDDGLNPDGALGLARHLSDESDFQAARRVLVAAVELWPGHEGLRAEAVEQSRAWDEAERVLRQGPRYDESGETFAEVDDDDEAGGGRL